MHKPDRVCQRMNVEYLILFSFLDEIQAVLLL